MPLGPVYALQLAISYINLAIPTAAARIAVNVRFFQRQGVPPGAAVATGALDGVSGFIVQALLLGSLLLFSSLSLDVDLDGPASKAIRIAWMVGVILAVVVVVILAIPRLRRYVLGGVRRTAHEAFTVLRGLRSPRRLVMLFGGNLVAELLFALALGVFVQAFGYSLELHELLFINMSVSLLAGLLPGTRRCRRHRGRVDLRTDLVRCPPGGGVRRRDAVPLLHLLHAADLGILLTEVARTEPVPLIPHRSADPPPQQARNRAVYSHDHPCELLEFEAVGFDQGPKLVASDEVAVASCLGEEGDAVRAGALSDTPQCMRRGREPRPA